MKKRKCIFVGNPIRDEIKKYIYNYDKRSYDCVINYYTDKDQKVIKDFEYNSDKCYYISYF